ncbi:MAG: DUF434 domain-containing protein [Candidatus Aminicenantes bacterium]|nr:MAG: DUF434 domain-containing protein [Candidatus Aminicenantes bacterium]
MANKNLITAAFKGALTDYYYLLNKNYPEKETLKLVGDRFRLTGVQRTLLFRGITSKENALKRISKLIPLENSKGKILYIDGYNVLFTMMNYLLGKTIFIGNDGILRDPGAAYGKIENQKTFYQSADLLVNFIPKGDLEEVTIYLDSPVSNSSSHINALEKKIRQKKIRAETHLVQSVDRRLKQINNGVIATSDSEIIDQTPVKILDLARKILETTYRISILDLGTLIVDFKSTVTPSKK